MAQEHPANVVNKKQILVLAGPTSSGKSSLALDLCKTIGAEIMSADSRQIYKGMDIGTGKIPFDNAVEVTKSDNCWLVDGVNIWGYDLVNPDQYFSAYDYADFALKRMGKLIEQEKTTFLVGGTGFYIDMVTGRSKPSNIIPDLELRAELEKESLGNLQKKLMSLNISMYNSIDQNNSVRIIRAIEKELNKENTSPPLPYLENYTFKYVGLSAPNDFLFDRVDKWLEKSWDNCLIDEVKALIDRGFGPSPKLQGLVYKSVVTYLNNALSESEAKQKACFDLHAYIRRQLTWFRKNEEIEWFDVSVHDKKTLAQIILDKYLYFYLPKTYIISSMDKQVVISIRTIIFTFLLILGGYIIYRLGPIIGILLVSLLIVFAVEPLIKYIMRGVILNRRISRGIAVIVVYVILLFLLAGVVSIGLPPFVVEAQRLLKSLISIIQAFQFGEGISINIPDILPEASKLSGGVLSATLSIFSNIATFFSIFIMSLYMSLDWVNLKMRFAGMFPDKYQEMVADTLDEIETSIGHWVKGEFILMFVVGFLSLIGLLALDVNYPFALALISGLLEVVPMLGPILSAVLAALIGFADEPIKGIGVVVMYTVIQQFENNILVPKVMQKVSGFSPLIILLALLIGSEFFGITGAILSVPSTMILMILLRRYLRAQV